MYTVTDLGALTRNADILKSSLGDLYCVLKCNAYGHGLKQCASALYGAGMRRFAVFSLSEALTIYPLVNGSDILILGRTERNGISAVAEHGFIQTVFSEEYAKELASVGSVPRLHVKIDTGMNRSGLSPDGERIYSSLSGLYKGIEGAYTHFPSADSEDLSDTEERLSVFLNAEKALELLLNKRLTRHSAASAAAARLPKARLDISRTGLLLYGISPCKEAYIPGLTPVMSLLGRVVGVKRVKAGETVGYGRKFVCKRDSFISTVDGGYANGVFRCLAGRFMPSIHGRRVPLVAVCMDRCMLDVTELAEGGICVKAGDEVTFFGKDIPVTEAASAAKTISYEILTSARPNV